MTELLVRTGGYLSQVFRPVDTYASEIEISHELDAECFICRDTYSTNTGSGCRALRLKHCNHLIGKACFAEWIRRQPEICPYWYYHPPPPPQGMNQRLPCSTRRELACQASTRCCLNSLVPTLRPTARPMRH
ncbi:hypothetical protein J1614_006647 [Plenodomus biglobosus]|nr:hypothetical protein J1614_006647 [Plenodomus biglobosus]